MPAMTVTAARKGLFNLVAQVNLDRQPVEIIGKKGSAVLMSLDEYEALQTTRYLMSNPNNAKRILDGIADAKAGRFQVKELDED